MPERIAPKLADLLNNLLNPSQTERLGAKGGDDVMAHDFFAHTDWEKLRVGELTSPLHTFVQDRRAQQIADGPGDDLMSWEIDDPSSAPWLQGFDAPK